MLLHGIPPALLAVGQVPLVGGGDDALVVGARHDPGFGLEVQAGLSSGDHLVPDLGLGIADLLSLVGAVRHDAHGEALEVGLVLGLGQLGLVVEALDLELLAHVDRGGVAVSLDGDDGDDVKGLDHVAGDAVLLGEVGLVLEGLEGDVVIGGVGGDGGDDAGAVVHANGQQGEGVHLVVRGIGRTEGQTEELVARKGFQAGDLAELLGVVLALVGVEQLAGQSSGRSGAHDATDET